MRIMQGNKDHKLCFTFKREYVILLVSFSVLLLKASEASVCQRYDYAQNDAAVLPITIATPNSYNAVKVNYTCPGLSDPKHHTECCHPTSQKKGCCARSRYFYEIDKTIAAAIAISVTSICILITVTIIVCCFWYRCPLYSSCRTECSPEIATYVSKEDNIDMDTMPREISKKNNKFSPIAISNGNIPSGVDMEAI